MNTWELCTVDLFPRVSAFGYVVAMKVPPRQIGGRLWPPPGKTPPRAAARPPPRHTTGAARHRSGAGELHSPTSGQLPTCAPSPCRLPRAPQPSPPDFLMMTPYPLPMQVATMTLRQVNGAFFGLLAEMKTAVIARTGTDEHWKSGVALPMFGKLCAASVFHATADVRKRVVGAAPQAAARAPANTAPRALGLLAKGRAHQAAHAP